MAHIGIFGPTLCGKTTLAKHLARSYIAQGYGCLVLPAFPDDWGKGVWVAPSTSAFVAKVERSRCCMVFIEEAASMIRRDAQKMEWFTAIRHRGHLLHVIGHSGTDLLPGMRRQLTRLFLFRQSKQAASIWADEWADERLLDAQMLGQYEFLHARLFGDVVRSRIRL